MKELKEFTVEWLEYLASNSQKAVTVDGEGLAALAKIALAAKKAKPALVFDKPDALSYRNLIKNFEVGTEFYTTPPLNHAEQDGWKLVPEEATIAMLTLLGVKGSLEFMQQKYKNMLDASPEPDDALISDGAKSDGWIKCSERMPECSKWDHAAVIASEGSNSFVAYYNKHECKFLDEPFGESLGNKITHWMPLPTPPVAAPKPEK